MNGRPGLERFAGNRILQIEKPIFDIEVERLRDGGVEPAFADLLQGERRRIDRDQGNVAGLANRGTPALPPIAVAFGLYLVAVVITVAVNVPMNDAIKAAGDPAHIDVTQVRAQFNEARWSAANLVRVATSVPAFGLLAWALVLCGRETA